MTANRMRFAHIADAHLGVWGAHPELKPLPLAAFERAAGICIEEKVDFAVISGDFFDTSMPPIDVTRFAVEQLIRFRDAKIPVYAIAGSHDYSPTGKTMLSVLEAAGLMKNVNAKLVEDERTGTLIFGIEGLRGGLDKHTFEELSVDVSGENRFRIFMMHSAIQEYSLPMAESVPLSMLPKGFDYYANGHVHVRLEKDEDIGKIVFPGPIFPCNFSELEDIGFGSFCVIDVVEGRPHVCYKNLRMCGVELVNVEADGKQPKNLEEEFADIVSKLDLGGKILLLKAKGRLSGGKPIDIDWRRVSDLAGVKGALSVKKSVHLEAPQTETVQSEASSVEQIEEEIVRKWCKSDSEVNKMLGLMAALNIEKGEDETTAFFDERVKSNANKALGIGEL